MLKRFIVCLVVLVWNCNSSVATDPVEEERGQFMKDALGRLEGLINKQPQLNVKFDYKTNDKGDNSTSSVEIKIESNVTKGNVSEGSNVTSHVAKGEPGFGDGVGSGFHGHLPRGQGIQGNQGQSVNRGQSFVQGQRFPGPIGNQQKQNRQYPGFGSPEIEDSGLGGLNGRGLQQGNLQQWNNGQIIGGLRVPQHVPDGRMGLPRLDGCLCTGPILNRCCFEPPQNPIRGLHSTAHPPGHHHPHNDQQANLKLPGVSNIVSPKPPVGLEYRGDFTCPVMNGNFPHPTDCSRFLQCSHSVPYDTPCPEGLLYDTTTGMCNWPDLVRCETPAGPLNSNNIFNTTLIIPSSWQVSWSKCRSIEVAVNAVLISVSQAVLGKPCPNSDCQFPYIIVNCLK